MQHWIIQCALRCCKVPRSVRGVPERSAVPVSAGGSGFRCSGSKQNNASWMSQSALSFSACLNVVRSSTESIQFIAVSSGVAECSRVVLGGVGLSRGAARPAPGGRWTQLGHGAALGSLPRLVVGCARCSLRRRRARCWAPSVTAPPPAQVRTEWPEPHGAGAAHPPVHVADLPAR